MKQIFTLLLSFLAMTSFAQNVDLASVDEFFLIADKLKKGEVVDEEQWNRFDNSVAYSIFSKAEDKRVINIVKSSMKNVFANQDVKERLNENDLLEAWVLANYEDVNRNYSDIKTFRDNYDFELLVDNAKLRLQSFLGCERFDSTIKLKPVCFFFLSKDGQDIEYLQEVMMQYVRNQIDKDTCVDKLLEIYRYNGHALGFYMSNQIIEAGYKDEMLKEFYNTYRFYELYSLALDKNKGTSLNNDFLIWLKKSYGL